METIEFHPLTAKDRDVYNYYYQKSGTRLTDLTFSCRMAWNTVFRSEMAVFEDCCILISDGFIFTDPHILMPMGELDSDRLDRIFTALHPIMEARGWGMKIMCIDESQLALFEGLKNFSFDMSFNEDSSDYIYDAESLRTLSGKVLHKKRNHVNKFIRTYPDYQYTSVTCADKDDCLALVKEWCESKSIDYNNVEESDYKMIHELLDLCGKTEIRGGVIRIEGKVRAFALGSHGNHNQAFIHFEKADAAVPGIYAAINQLVLQHEFPDVVTVNREEDLGIPGLRKAKQSYEPIHLLRKYKTWLTPL